MVDQNSEKSSQTKQEIAQIKEAVNFPNSPPQNTVNQSPQYPSQNSQTQTNPEFSNSLYNEVNQSNSTNQPISQEIGSVPPPQDIAPPTPGQMYEESYSPSQNEADYSSYNAQQYQYSAPLSSDTITEISEQVVSEKIANIKNLLERNIDLKNTYEVKISSLSERLQRIEKIIDQLQLSVLQKVGDYVSNVSDLKNELIQTQKSFNMRSPKPTKTKNKHNKSHKHKK